MVRTRGQRVIRRVVFTLGGLVGLFVVLAIIGAIVGPPPSNTASSSSPTPTPTSSSSATPPLSFEPTPVVAPAPPAPLTVSRVIDGDTFVVGTDTVRVLGIDSCESSTDAGPAATAEATSLLVGPITLTAEPGVDRDRYGRLLRYVTLADGEDFGTVMVRATHTAIYAGRNDASVAYIRALRDVDLNVRTCDYPDPVAPVTTYDLPDVDAPSVPDRHTGHSGHPCLPGERDGDSDGYCGEGR